MAFKTVREALTSKAFRGQLFMTVLINFAINFGVGWGTFNGWGSKTDPSTWAALNLWKWNYEQNSCLGMDVLVTCFCVACFCCLLGSGGAQKEVLEKKCEYLAAGALQADRRWRWTPVLIQNLCLRSLANGLYFTALAGLPAIIVMWIALGNSGTMAGYNYVVFKGIYAALVAMPVFVIVFLSAIDARNFPELEFDALMRAAGAGGAGSKGAEQPPMVANVGLI